MIMIAVLMMLGFKGFAQNKVYKDGSVWVVTTVKTTYGAGDEYIKSLQTTWKAVNDEAVKQGLILSYKILQGVAANPEDYDMLLLVEYKNLAAMESSSDKFDAIYKSKVGDESAMNKLRDSRVSIRTIMGSKVMREVVYQ